jgi:hypothetical protein
VHLLERKDFEASAVAWMLDVLPAGQRKQLRVHRYPIGHAFMSRRSARTGGCSPPPAITEQRGCGTRPLAAACKPSTSPTSPSVIRPCSVTWRSARTGGCSPSPAQAGGNRTAPTASRRPTLKAALCCRSPWWKHADSLLIRVASQVSHAACRREPPARRRPQGLPAMPRRRRSGEDRNQGHPERSPGSAPSLTSCPLAVKRNSGTSRPTSELLTGARMSAARFSASSA